MGKRRKADEDRPELRANEAGKARAMALGCRCDECPLRDAPGPVFPEVGADAAFLVLGETPDYEDAAAGRPFAGDLGRLVMGNLRGAGISRAQTAMAHTVMCLPPGGDLKRLEARVRRLNTERGRVRRIAAKATKAKSKAAKAEAVDVPDLSFSIEGPANPIPLPAVACRPALIHLLREVRPRYYLPLGGLPSSALLGGDVKIAQIRGSVLEGHLTVLEGPPPGPGLRDLSLGLLPLDLPETAGDVIVPNARIMPTFPPGLVRAQPRWTETVRRDVNRLARWSRGELTWREPEIEYDPSPARLLAFLQEPGAFTYDVETDGIEPLSCNVRCVAIGRAGRVLVVGVRPKAMHPNERGEAWPPYPAPIMEQIKAVLRWFFGNPQIVKIGHNAGYYDRLVIRQWLGVEPNPTWDTMLAYRLTGNSELPKGLGFVGSHYTDVHNWKSDHKGRKISIQADSDRELHHYCALDVAVTEAVIPGILADARKAEQDHILAVDLQVQQVCADMHHVGMYVDQEKRAKVEDGLLRRVVELRAKVQEAAGIPDFNPGSVHALRRLLFDTWGLVPPLDDKFRFTGTGDPSTNDDVIRSLYLQPGLPPQQRALLGALRGYRSATKELGTYVVKLRPMTELIPKADLYDADAHEALRLAEREGDAALLWSMEEEMQSRGYLERGIVWADGRMRPGYNSHVAVTGRLSSSSPINAQNFPKHLRAMIVPAPGHVFVGADADQLELRIAAAAWGLRKYLDAFDADLDPHSAVTAYAIFGDRFVKAAGSPWPWKTGSKFKGDAHEMRQLSKIIQYAYQYKASVETGARIIQATEMDDGSFPYARLSVPQVRQMRDDWLAGVPEMPAAWQAEIDFFRRHGFVEERIHGRRRFCLDGENPNELVNFKIQASAAAHINDAMVGIWRDIPLWKWGPGTGLLTQTHDAMVVECPPKHAAEVVEIINARMNSRHKALPGVLLSANAEIGHNWKEVG